jgi:hypothetical protein
VASGDVQRARLSGPKKLRKDECEERGGEEEGEG